MSLNTTVLSNWSTLVDGYTTSGLDFYREVEEAVVDRDLPEAKFSRVHFDEGGFGSAKRKYLRIERRGVVFDVCAAPYGKSFFFSWWESRLGPKHPVLWTLLVFLGVLFPTGWFMDAVGLTTWLGFLSLPIATLVILVFLGFLARARVFGPEENITEIPVLGRLYAAVFKPITYFSLDTATMFRESVRRAVNDVLQGALSDQGLRALSEEQLKPSIRALAA